MGSAGQVAETTSAKQRLTFVLKVTNWLKKAQRFDVLWPENESRFSGAKTIDVPAQGSRDYKLGFMGYKEGETLNATITFKNPDSGEYIFYEVSATVTDPIVMGKINLETVVRQPTQYLLTIENPLTRDKPVTFGE